jgi:glycosyltransferase involved in cell wall biosynthesis
MNLGKPRATYSPDFTVPSPGSPTTITVHDLAWMIRPEFTPTGLRRFLDKVVPAQIAKADRVFAVSETTRNDILNRFAIDETRVVVARNAAGDQFFNAAPGNTSSLSNVSLPEDYLLVVGSIEPRKNHLNLLKAIERIPECPLLVIAGGPGWENAEIMEEIVRSSRKGKVLLLGYVPDDSLRHLYAGARAVVSPSWYEGFGLPVLEGLAAGSRVVASDVPAHREVAGEYAVYVEPADVESIAGGILAALNLGRPGEESRSHQRSWARKNSWNRSASQVYQALVELI